VNELDRHATIVVYCHHGVRSALAAQWLSEQGFPAVRNLAGGIDAWAEEVDETMPRY
jgi:rhodanese-related sulfurtransferase